MAELLLSKELCLESEHNEWRASKLELQNIMAMSLEVYGGVLEWFSLSKWCASEKKEGGSRLDTVGISESESSKYNIDIF